MVKKVVRYIEVIESIPSSIGATEVVEITRGAVLVSKWHNLMRP